MDLLENTAMMITLELVSISVNQQTTLHPLLSILKLLFCFRSFKTSMLYDQQPKTPLFFMHF
jgi:hypothetical protein